MDRSCIFNGEYGAHYTLVDTDNLFIIKTRGIHALQLVRSIRSLLPYQRHFVLFESFPESSAYIFQCIGIDNPSALRAEIKKIVNSAKLPELEYIGNVKKFLGSDIYQIYTGNLFIKFFDSLTSSDVERLLRKFNLEVKLRLSYAQHAFFAVPTSDLGGEIFDFTIAHLANTEVEFCHPEMVVKNRSVNTNKSVVVKDSLNLPPTDWILTQTNVYEAWKLTKGAGTKICIIDDGIEASHPAFSRSGKIVAPIDMMDYKREGFPYHQFNERHGTACASIACSEDPKALGIAPDAQLMPIRITGLGSIYQSQAIYWAVNKGADVISCSWGPPDGLGSKNDDFVFPIPDHTHLAINYASSQGRNKKGCPVVFAAGNGNEPIKSDGYVSHPNVFAIGATNKDNRPTAYSDYGYPMLCCFPSGDYVQENNLIKRLYGVNVVDRLGEQGYDATDYYQFFDGTSASCPGVAGVIALMLSVNPDLTKGEIQTILKKSCLKIGSDKDYIAGYSDRFGYGLLMADLAVKNAKDYTNFRTSMNKNLPSKKAISLHIGINNVDDAYYKGLVSPLNGCVNDMEKMRILAEEIGYDTYTLRNEEATKEAILEYITQLGSQVEARGIFLITYAGHGAPIPGSMDADEKTDQSWVTYNGFLLDDELNARFATVFGDASKKIRVVVVSDSCHSRTVTRFANSSEKVRGIDLATMQMVLSKNNQTLESVKMQSRSSSNVDPQACILNLSACDDTQYAKEINGEGVFTKTLESLYRQLRKENTKIPYQQFIQKVSSKIGDNQQIPGLYQTGIENRDFINQFPFDIGGEIISTSSTSSAGQGVNIGSGKVKQLLVKTSKGWVSLPSQSTRGGKKEKIERKIVGSSISSEGIKGSSEWDKAYRLFLENQEQGVSYVEPDLVSNVFPIQESERQGERSFNNPDPYLPTYPSPPNDYSRSFIWHLDSKHSQLRAANELVFPEIILEKVPDSTKELVKIAHIDTGILPRHPIKPLFLEPGMMSFMDDVAYEGAVDHDIPLFENQGHGNATLAILAGGKVSYQESRGNFQGYFGAIPFAKVVSLRVSDSVVLLSGKNLAAAVEYAIQQKCDVITLSMGGLPSKVMAEAINKAYEAGIVIVAAAGNCFVKGVGKYVTPEVTVYPARFDRVIAAVGATFQDTPYLFNLQNKLERGGNGKYMQMSYGPQEVLKTTLAAYTPNLVWFGRIDGEETNQPLYFDWSGAGTSSATPQIAAAAALYIQKYRSQLDALAGKDRWKKVEMVREALFQSARKYDKYAAYFGNGILRAADALGSQFEPAEMHKIVVKKYKSEGAKKAVENRSLFTRLFGLFRGRNLVTNTSSGLHEMLNLELAQLLYRDENLSKYLPVIDLEGDALNLSNTLLEKFVTDVQTTSKASDLLKKILVNQNASISVTDRSKRGATAVRSIQLAYDSRIVEVKSRGIDMSVKAIGKAQAVQGVPNMIVDEFEIELPMNQPSRTINSMLEIADNYGEEGRKTALLIEIYDEEGIYYKWYFKNDNENEYEDVIDRSAVVQEDDWDLTTYNVNLVSTRGKGKIWKVIGKLFSWKKKKEDDKLVDDKYELIAFDLEKRKWERTINPTIKEALTKDERPLLLCIPGFLGNVEEGFEKFLSNELVKTNLLPKYNRYVIGFNMPSLIEGVQSNAEQLWKELEVLGIKNKACTIIARSRGGLVARYFYEVLQQSPTLKSKSLDINKIVFTGTPHQGTRMVDLTHWKILINIVTNLLRSTGLPIQVSSLVQAVAEGAKELPGMTDQAEGSEVITKLNSLADIKRDGYYCLTSDFEPKNIFRVLFDELLVDKLVFKGEANDCITPVQGALFNNPKYPVAFQLKSDQFYRCPVEEEVGHFKYLDPENEGIINRVLNWV